MMPYLTQHYGNPGSTHWYGQEPKQAVHRARLQILQLLHHEPDDDKQETMMKKNKNPMITNSGTNDNEENNVNSIWFTSCGTEADNLAIHLALQSTRHLFANDDNNNNEDKHNNNRRHSRRPHIVTSNIEHPAVEACLQVLQDEEQVCDVTYVPVQTDGRVLASDVIAAIRPEQTILVTLMLANNETGALQPVSEVAQHCRQMGILFHTDAAQAAGKVSVNLHHALGNADLVTLVGHKLGAPKGIACLYVRPNCLFEHGRHLSHHHGILLLGGGQEFGRRGGTENVPYMVGMGAAAERAAHEWKHNGQHMERMRTRLWSNLQHELSSSSSSSSNHSSSSSSSLVTQLQVNGPTHPNHRLPNTLSVGLAGIHSATLLAAVKDKVAASAGATCHSTTSSSSSSSAGISSVLQAMQVPVDVARGTLRLSVGPHTTKEEVDQAAYILALEMKRLLFATM